ncbi:MAG: D-sedoheptulose-7-phosphate isomerase [Thermoplasmatota archaeon]
MKNDINKAARILANSFGTGHKLLVCGNGGSASDADHIVAELVKAFKKRRPVDSEEAQEMFQQCGRFGGIMSMALEKGLPAISLNSQTSLITAIANDSGYEMVFAQQVYAYGEKGDVLIGITTSGESNNVLMALKLAKYMGMKTILLTGNEPPLYTDADLIIKTDASRTDLSQEEMTVIYHRICEKVEDFFFDA